MENHFVDLNRRRALDSYHVINYLIEYIEESKDLGNPKVQGSIKSKKRAVKNHLQKTSSSYER